MSRHSSQVDSVACSKRVSRASMALSTPHWCVAVRECHVSVAATPVWLPELWFISGDRRIRKIQQHHVFPKSVTHYPEWSIKHAVNSVFGRSSSENNSVRPVDYPEKQEHCFWIEIVLLNFCKFMLWATQVKFHLHCTGVEEEMDVSQASQIKPKLSACLDTTSSKWKNMLFFVFFVFFVI